MISRARFKKKFYFVVAGYFKFWANFSLKKWNPRIFAITGSVGKTTLLNLLEVQLKDKAHYSHNANSAFGISFDILGLTGVTGTKLKWLYLLIMAPIRSLYFSHHEPIYVVEIDGERPYETEFLARWLSPELTFWISFGRSHAVQFDAQVKEGRFKTVDDAILHEFAWLPKLTTKIIIYNDSEKLISKTVDEIKHTIKKVPIKKRSLDSYKVWPNRTEIEIDKTKFTFNQPMPEEVYVQVAMVSAVAKYLGEEPVTNFSEYIQPPGRGNYFEGIKNLQLIDSSYNAHLISMKSMIDLYKKMEAGSKWIVIGDVVDQGETEAEQHKELGRILKEANFDRYIFVGRRTQQHTYPELEASKAVTFSHPRDAIKYIKEETVGGETILFKGSQYLEGVVAELLKNKNEVRLLPRQESAAKKRRAKWGLK